MLLFILSLCGFASAMSGRVVDPIVTELANELGAPIARVALLSTAYALPFALMQPILGPLGDIYSKPRIVKIAVTLLAVFLAGAAVAGSLPLLFAARILAGMAGAAILPIGFALIGDLVGIEGRQVAISRFLAATLIGQIVGATGSGLLSHYVGWRGVFWGAALITALFAIAAWWRLPERPAVRSAPVGLTSAVANYASVLRNGRAFVCFGVVLVEGAAIYGCQPFLGDFLQSRNLGGVREAGLVISGLALGGLLYSLNVPLLLRLLDRRQMMAAGGTFAAVGLLCLSSGAVWPLEWVFMGITGFGFFMLHNPIQTEVSELAPTARASAFSLHSFNFYIGQAIGPVLYGAGLHTIGLPASLAIGAGGFLLAGLTAWRLLRV